MTRFLTQDSPIPPYMAFPRFLLDKDGLNETAKILYTILLDRARLSQKNDGWADEQGHVFIFFPIRNLAETMHKSEMSIKTALSALEKENLIVRKRQGAGFPNRIYVKYLPETLAQMDRNLSVRQTENCIPTMQLPYEAGHCVTILLLSNEPMNARRMKAYKTNQ